MKLTTLIWNDVRNGEKGSIITNNPVHLEVLRIFERAEYVSLLEQR